jgi:hypothetical protein
MPLTTINKRRKRNIPSEIMAYVEQLPKTEQELVLYKVKALSVLALAKKLSKGFKGKSLTQQQILKEVRAVRKERNVRHH